MLKSIPMTDQSHLGRKGIFYVGGYYSREEERRHRYNQMFLEVYEPKDRKHLCGTSDIFFFGNGF